MKKVRGLTRHFRRFEQSKHHPEPLTWDELREGIYVNEKLGLAPWVASSFANSPPGRFRREAFAKLLATHALWQRVLRGFPEPYYLAVWLMDSRFRDSQVVAGIRERVTRYEHVFGEPDPEAPPLPPEYRNVPGAEQLHWTAYHKEYADTFDAENATAEQQDWETRLRRRRYRTVEDEEYGTIYLFREGHVWVGRSPEELNP